MASSKGKKANRLLNEKSPYLLQHAYNPVDWYPWSKAAFEKAKEEDKMIFLSVGYSTCHWCHVMERESFESDEIAKLMNEKFINIKVDREERPDVDKMYMGFVQATTGSGGWPMSVWLTPDLKPVVGGTYFPPDDRYYGRPGFTSVINYVSEKWRTSKTSIASQGAQILEAIKQVNFRKASAASDVVANGRQIAKAAYEMLAESYDHEWGGFGSAPKFPQPSNFEFLLNYYTAEPEKGASALRMVEFTKKAMAKGGIHDHVAQGFHRYSTDGTWHVPHFEKMLYDQAQLTATYADVYRISKDEFFAEIVRDILTYVDRDLSHIDGGFFGAEDADSYPTQDAKEKKEGAFCVFTADELRHLLKKPIDEKKHGKVSLFDVFAKHFNVQEDGNVDPYQDPHDELKKQNVLIVLGSLDETAKAFDLDVEEAKNVLEEARQILYRRRKERPPPHLDTKIITAWNALMITGFAKASAALKNAEYGNRAIKAADFLKKCLYNHETRTLLHSCYVDEDKKRIVQIAEPIHGFADDYAFLIAALLDLYELVHCDDAYLKLAVELQTKMDELFWDNDQHSGYFQCSADDESILIRMKEDQDGAEPSANSVAVVNLIRLANLLDEAPYMERAKTILAANGDKFKKLPIALPKMICGLLMYSEPFRQIVIVGGEDEAESKKMLDTVRSEFLPFSILISLGNGKDDFVKSKNERLKSLTPIDGKATAYVCANFACSIPVRDSETLRKSLIGSSNN